MTASGTRRFHAAVTLAFAAAFSASAFAVWTSSYARVMSPTVVTSYIATDGKLSLVVLWRGSPGWFSRGGSGSSGSGGGSSAGGSERGQQYFTYGGITQTLEFDWTAQIARVMNQEISLKTTNLILVDEIDSASGGRIVAQRWIDPTLPETGDPVLMKVRGEPELIAFLQCDLTLPDPMMDRMMRIICDQVTTP